MSTSGRFQSLPPAPRRAMLGAFGATFIIVIFGLLPGWMADLNHELAWPRWNATSAPVAGVTLFVASLGLVLYCSRLFSSIGRGTPIPIAPPTELVVSGIYRFTRNPIYVGQVGVLLSYFLYSGELALLIYAGVWLLLIQGFVVWVEEPGLRRRFGAAYVEYTHTVPRWVGVPARRSRAVS